MISWYLIGILTGILINETLRLWSIHKKIQELMEKWDDNTTEESSTDTPD